MYLPGNYSQVIFIIRIPTCQAILFLLFAITSKCYCCAGATCAATMQDRHLLRSVAGIPGIFRLRLVPALLRFGKTFYWPRLSCVLLTTKSWYCTGSLDLLSPAEKLQGRYSKTKPLPKYNPERLHFPAWYCDRIESVLARLNIPTSLPPFLSTS